MKPRWTRSQRFERAQTLTLDGAPSDVFPLLCPVLEYEWLPRWKCRMFYADSGVAERDAVFHTRETLLRSAVWTVITYEPDRLIEYLIVIGRDAIIRLSLSLEAKAEKTLLGWRMRFTLTSAPGRAMVGRRFSEAGFQKMMRARTEELNHYLTTKTMISRR
ncbi:MAG TPA: SRPBCC family protein [Spirochaetia bacterium]|nr:SRPBCC family protein [Spirochaetia bacterium]